MPKYQKSGFQTAAYFRNLRKVTEKNNPAVTCGLSGFAPAPDYYLLAGKLKRLQILVTADKNPDTGSR